LLSAAVDWRTAWNMTPQLSGLSIVSPGLSV